MVNKDGEDDPDNDSGEKGEDADDMKGNGGIQRGFDGCFFGAHCDGDSVYCPPRCVKEKRREKEKKRREKEKQGMFAGDCRNSRSPAVHGCC